jgi:hypothetical protein
MLAGRRSGCLEQYWQLDAGSLKGDNNDIASGVPLEPCNTAMQYSHAGIFRYFDVNGASCTMIFAPNPSLCSKFYTWNSSCMPVVKFFVCLDFGRKSSFGKRLMM